MSEVRESGKLVLKSFFKFKIISVITIMTSYILLLVYSLHLFNLWNPNQVKNTIIWYFSIAFFSLFKITSKKEVHNFLKNTIWDFIKLSTLIEFFLTFYSLNIFLEFILVPVFIVLGGVLAVAQSKREYKSVEKFLNFILVISGLYLFYHAVKVVLSDYKSFFNKETLDDFYIPILLTILYVPFILIMSIFVAYENTFIRLNILIKNPKTLTYAKFYSMLRFHFKISLLERWQTLLSLSKPETNLEIKNSVNQLYKMFKTEKNPPAVDIKDGWSPYKAKDFLTDIGVKTGYYSPTGGEDWFSCSNYIPLSENPNPNNISYYISGSEQVAKSLKLIVNFNSIENRKDTHKLFCEFSKQLFSRATKMELPPSIIKAIISGKNHKTQINEFLISVEKNEWGNINNGYNLNFHILKK